MNPLYKDVICEYNDILVGIKKRFSQSVNLNEKIVKEIGRYAFEYYLEWTPFEIKIGRAHV